MDRIAIVLGTRPEIIKLSPIIKELGIRRIPFYIVHTGQHYDHNLSGQFFTELGIDPPEYVGTSLSRVFEEEPTRLVIVQGDTDSAWRGMASAVLHHIPVAHVEAGIRSFDDEMPEEWNRRDIDHRAKLLFAPTDIAKENLRLEGRTHGVYMVGNTITDVVDQMRPQHPIRDEYALLTIHRPALVDNKEQLSIVMKALSPIWMPIVFPIHPRTAKNIEKFKIKIPKNVRVIQPVSYSESLKLIAEAKVVMTDSGGVQEEACLLQTPCVTIRDNTERPETLEIGNILAGINEISIPMAVRTMTSGPIQWRNPYGKDVSRKIINTITSIEK